MKSGDASTRRKKPVRERAGKARRTATRVDEKRIHPVRANAVHAAIVRVIRAIPAGCVTSYGEVAARAGAPGRARLVGRVLGEFSGEDLPWFRVMRAGGRIAFEPGTRGFREQARRLAAEGVLVVRGRVDVALHGWERNLDAMLWAPPLPAGRAAAKKPKSTRKV